MQYPGHRASLFLVQFQSDALQTQTTVNEEESFLSNLKQEYWVNSRGWLHTIGSEALFSNATSFILGTSVQFLCPALPLV